MNTPLRQALYAWRLANRLGHLWATECPPETWGAETQEIDWSLIAERAASAMRLSSDVLAPNQSMTARGVVLWHVSAHARFAWGVGLGEDEDVRVALHILRPRPEDAAGLPGLRKPVDLTHTALRIVWAYGPMGFSVPSVQVGPAPCHARHIDAIWFAVDPLAEQVPLAEICRFALPEEGRGNTVLGLPVVLGGEGPGIIGDPRLVEEGNPLLWVNG